MKIVVALGGNALLRRGQPMTADNQLANIRIAATQLARVATDHQLVITHGNGPQIGLLALQSAADTANESYPLDVLGAQTDGMIGYLLEQELANQLPSTCNISTLLTRVEVDPNDIAFQNPTKPIGPVYTLEQSEQIAITKKWRMAPDEKAFRRVVASPQPLKVLGLNSIKWLLDQGVLVIAAGGGGIPVARAPDGQSLHGVEAVIDKDLCSGLLARELDADCLVIVTDVAAVYLDWGLPSQLAIGKTTPQALKQHHFPAGSMGPKVQAAIEFASTTGKTAVIGSLEKIEAMLAGNAGTQISVAS
jgi:carbamate kinase